MLHCFGWGFSLTACSKPRGKLPWTAILGILRHGRRYMPTRTVPTPEIRLFRKITVKNTAWNPLSSLCCVPQPIPFKKHPILYSNHFSHTAKGTPYPHTERLHFYFLFAFTIFVFIKYQSAPVMHTEEYAPQMMPAIRGRANSRMLVTPNTYRAATMTNVVREV